MRITKFGHCCLLIEEGEARILIDPGSFSAPPADLAGIDAILITHEHPDHIQIDHVRSILKNNPGAKIVTNKGVESALRIEGMAYEVVEHEQFLFVKDVLIEGFGEKHAIMYPSLPRVPNTGYFIGKRFFYPGDALTAPPTAVDVLALPVAGPWLKLSEAIDYAREVRPKRCVPVHDGILKAPGSAHRIPMEVLAPYGIPVTILEDGVAMEF